MTGSLFVNTTFGAEDPLNEGYLSTSLNIGQEDGSSLWELLGRDAIDLDPALSGHILYNETTGCRSWRRSLSFTENFQARRLQSLMGIPCRGMKPPLRQCTAWMRMYHQPCAC